MAKSIVKCASSKSSLVKAKVGIKVLKIVHLKTFSHCISTSYVINIVLKKNGQTSPKWFWLVYYQTQHQKESD